MKKWIFILGILLLINSCRKQQDTAHLKDHFTLQNKGADMPVWVEGNLNSNALVVIVHGGPGGDGQVYNTFMEDFSNRMESQFAMVYCDQRGGGNTTGYSGQDNYTVATFVDDLDKLIDVLKMRYGKNRSIFLLGHSWGGTLITAYALDLNRQSKLRGFIEVDGAHNFMGTDAIINTFKAIGQKQIADGHHISEWQGIIDYCNKVNPNAPTDNQIVQLNKYGFTAESYLQDVDSIVNYGGKIDATSYFFTGSLHYPLSQWNALITSNVMFQELKSVNYTSQMGQIKIPSLFMWGKYDMVVPQTLGIAGYMACGAVDKAYAQFLNSGHSPMLNQMLDFVNVVVPWINARK